MAGWGTVGSGDITRRGGVEGGGKATDGRVQSIIFASPCVNELDGIGTSPDVDATSRTASLRIIVEGVRGLGVALGAVPRLGFGPLAYVQEEVRLAFFRKEVVVLVVP